MRQLCRDYGFDFGSQVIVKQPQGEGFFTEDPQAMSDLSNPAATSAKIHGRLTEQR